MSQKKAVVRVVGLSESTFTRSIVMSLLEKGVHYEQIQAAPHSVEAKKHHPFGRLPSVGFLIDSKQKENMDDEKNSKKMKFENNSHSHSQSHSHNNNNNNNDKDKDQKEEKENGEYSWIFESQAVARFIDRHFTQKPHLSHQDALSEGLIAQWVSAIADYVFPVLEHQLVKIRCNLQNKGVKEDDISKALESGLCKTKTALSVFEEMASGKEYLFGDSLSWVDLFLAPLLSDLFVTPESSVMSDFPKLSAWFATFTKRSSYISTIPGSLEDQLKKK